MHYIVNRWIRFAVTVLLCAAARGYGCCIERSLRVVERAATDFVIFKPTRWSWNPPYDKVERWIIDNFDWRRLPVVSERQSEAVTGSIGLEIAINSDQRASLSFHRVFRKLTDSPKFTPLESGDSSIDKNRPESRSLLEYGAILIGGFIIFVSGTLTSCYVINRYDGKSFLTPLCLLGGIGISFCTAVLLYRIADVVEIISQ